MILIILTFVSVIFNTHADHKGLDHTFKAKNFDRPKREISIISTSHGYYPDKLSVFEGEEVKFFVTGSSKNKQCFFIKDHDIFLSAQMGRLTEGTTIFNRKGKFEFYCPGSKFKGHITVLANKRQNQKISQHCAQETEKTRAVASEGPAYWVPRNYD